MLRVSKRATHITCTEIWSSQWTMCFSGYLYSRESRFGKSGKLSLRYIGPFEILDRISSTVYRVALSPALSRIRNVYHISSLRKYVPDPLHVLEYEPITIRENLLYKEQPMQILIRKEQILRNRRLVLVKVLWRNLSVEEATWEREEEMKERYAHLFLDLGTF